MNCFLYIINYNLKYYIVKKYILQKIMNYIKKCFFYGITYTLLIKISYFYVKKNNNN